MNIKRFIPYLSIAIVGVALASCATVHTASTGFDSKQFQFNDSKTVLQDKIFYLLSEIEKSPRLKKEITGDKTLDEIYRQKATEISKASENCADMSCLADGLTFDSQEAAEAAQALGNLYHQSEAIRSFVKNNIRPSGFYQLSDKLSDSALFLAAWNEQVAGLNYIIGAYLEDRGLQYAKIDSASFYVNSSAYLDSVRAVIRKVQEKDRNQTLFFKPLLDICLDILRLNGRNEAGRFEPMEQTNKEAYKYIRSTDWAQYPYSAILVFGEGPEEPGVAISEGNKERCNTAVEIFKKGKAPFLIVSGGYVHPFRTSYCEAEQMKKYMVTALGIAADKIIMEPHARHTTTNIRNANRIIYRNNIPADKPVLGVSSPSHIKYIAGKSFERICRRDLQYLPFERMKQLSPVSVEYYPSLLSLQLNTKEPLDP